MMMKSFSLLSAVSVLCLLAGPATAQRFDNFRLEQRVGELEKELEYVRSQAQAKPQPVQSNPGAVTAKLGVLEEDMRNLRGDIEKVQHGIKMLEESLKRFQEDVEFRLQQSGGAQAGAPVVTMPPNLSVKPPQPTLAANQPTQQPPVAIEKPAPGQPQLLVPPQAPVRNNPVTVSPPQQPPAQAAPSVLTLPDEKLDTPRSLYNQAFRLLNQTDYDGAETHFKQFTSKYPEDPLIGNAWYWLGETYYVRRSYIKAADSFRQGFEVLPDGPKAGDNLLKLAMSLSALQKTEEACIVLRQVDERYSGDSESLRNRAQQELNRLNCSAG